MYLLLLYSNYSHTISINNGTITRTVCSYTHTTSLCTYTPHDKGIHCAHIHTQHRNNATILLDQISNRDLLYYCVTPHSLIVPSSSGGDGEGGWECNEVGVVLKTVYPLNDATQWTYCLTNNTQILSYLCSSIYTNMYTYIYVDCSSIKQCRSLGSNWIMGYFY